MADAPFAGWGNGRSIDMRGEENRKGFAVTLFVIFIIGGVLGLLTGAVLRRVGLVARLTDVGFGMVGAFVAGAMASGALVEGLSRVALVAAAVAAVVLVACAHVASALLRPVHAKYRGR